MIRKTTSVAILALLLLPSCATIIASGPDMVPVNSDPEGAIVKLDGVPVGRTPLTVAFPRGCEGFLTFELDGIKTSRDLDKVVNGWVFGNLIFGVGGVIIGGFVDLVTSNQGKYSTAPIFVDLTSLLAREEETQ